MTWLGSHSYLVRHRAGVDPRCPKSLSSGSLLLAVTYLNSPVLAVQLCQQLPAQELLPLEHPAGGTGSGTETPCPAPSSKEAALAGGGQGAQCNSRAGLDWPHPALHSLSKATCASNLASRSLSFLICAMGLLVLHLKGGDKRAKYLVVAV